jgi:hypothetical protein
MREEKKDRRGEKGEEHTFCLMNVQLLTIWNIPSFLLLVQMPLLLDVVVMPIPWTDPT